MSHIVNDLIYEELCNLSKVSYERFLTLESN